MNPDILQFLYAMDFALAALVVIVWSRVCYRRGREAIRTWGRPRRLPADFPDIVVFFLALGIIVSFAGWAYNEWHFFWARQEILDAGQILRPSSVSIGVGLTRLAEIFGGLLLCFAGLYRLDVWFATLCPPAVAVGVALIMTA